MSSQLVYGFMLTVDGQEQPRVYDSLESAQMAAAPYLTGDEKLSIRSTSEKSPTMPMRVWNYDRAAKKWIQRS